MPGVKSQKKSKNAMLQKEERCCKYKVTHQYWCKENSIEKKGQCHVARTETMLQGRGCLCNRGDSASAMRGCGCDSANPFFKETQSNNDDWANAKFLGKTEVGRIDTYAEQTMELQVGQRRKIQKSY